MIKTHGLLYPVTLISLPLAVLSVGRGGGQDIAETAADLTVCLVFCSASFSIGAGGVMDPSIAMTFSGSGVCRLRG